jgi:hypothetical protein
MPRIGQPSAPPLFVIAAWIWLFAHVFVDLASLPRSVGDATAAVDDRFPQRSAA